MNRFNADDARSLLIFDDPDAGSVSFDEQEDSVEYNEDVPDEICESDLNLNDNEKTYAELRPYAEQEDFPPISDFYTYDLEPNVANPFPRSQTRILGFVNDTFLNQNDSGFPSDRPSTNLSNSTVNSSNSSDQNATFFSGNNTIWHKNVQSTFASDLECPVPTLTDNVMHLTSILDFFEYFINQNICEKILLFTNKRLRPNECPITMIELRAFFGK
jgi:hypothetical protein